MDRVGLEDGDVSFRLLESASPRSNEVATDLRALESYVPAGGGVEPDDIADLYVWYDAADAATFTYSSGVSVATWGDRSANALHVNAASSGDEPQRSGTLNSLPTVVFDNDWMVRDSPPVTTQPLTVFLVGKAAAWAGTGKGLIGAPVRILRGFNEKIYIGAGVDSTGHTVDTNWHLYAIVFNGASSQQRIDSVQVGTEDTGTAGFTSIRIGADQDINKLVGEIAEVVAYTRVLTAGEIGDIETYLETKWGL